MIPRSRHLERITAALTRNPVIGLIGARQVGETTLARQGFAMQQVVSILELRREDSFFWATHGGAELDLLIADLRLD